MRPTHPPVAYVEWVDTATVSAVWQDREAALKEAGPYLESICAAGFLLADDPRGVIICTLYNHHNDDAGHIVAIPRSAIRKVQITLKGKGFHLDPTEDKGPGATGLFK
jgi:hypothetical protein